MRLPVPFDTQIAARLCSQIDPCEFRAVKRYFRNPRSEIQLVVLVQAPYALEEVATVFATIGNGGADLQTLLRLGVIKFGVDDRNRVQVAVRDKVVLLDSIPDHQDYDVIYLPPCYVVPLQWLGAGWLYTQRVPRCPGSCTCRRLAGGAAA
jgi:hypothetical protein